jgi:hypothetical protein
MKNRESLRDATIPSLRPTLHATRVCRERECVPMPCLVGLILGHNFLQT